MALSDFLIKNRNQGNDAVLEAMNIKTGPVPYARKKLTSIPSGPLSGDSISYADLTVPYDPISLDESKSLSESTLPEDYQGAFDISPFPDLDMDKMSMDIDTSIDNDTLKQRVLNPTDEKDFLLSLDAQMAIRDENATPEEKEGAISNALAAFISMNQFDTPTQNDIFDRYKKQLKDNGINIDAYKDINRAGDPFIAMGTQLVEASRAGYTPAQALATSLAAFGAAQRAAKLPDPNHFNMVMKLLEASATEAAAYQRATGTTTYNDYRIGRPNKETGEIEYSIEPMSSSEVARAKLFGYDLSKATEGQKAATSYKWLDPTTKKIKSRSMNLDAYDKFVKDNPDTTIREVDETWNDIHYAINKEGGIVSGTMDDILMMGPDITPLKDTKTRGMYDRKLGYNVPVSDEQVLEDMKLPIKDRRYQESISGDVSTITIGPDSTQVTTAPAGYQVPGTFTVANLQAQNDKITKATEAPRELLNAQTANITELTKTIGLIEPLLNKSLGGTGSRGLANITGILDSAKDLAGLLFANEDTKPELARFDILNDDNEVVDTVSYDEMYNRYLAGSGVFGGVNSLNNIQKSSYYKKLSQAGIEQSRLDQLLFHLAIAGARSKGETGRALSDKDLALWIKGFGGQAMTSDRFTSNIFTTANMLLGQYDSTLKLFPKSGGLIGVIKQGTKKNQAGEDLPTLETEWKNPLEIMGYITMGADGEYTIDPAKSNVFDTAPFRDRYQGYLDSVGTVVDGRVLPPPANVVTLDISPESVKAWADGNTDSEQLTKGDVSFGQIIAEYKPNESKIIKLVADEEKITDIHSEKMGEIIQKTRTKLLSKLAEKYFKDDQQMFGSFVLYLNAYDRRNKKP